MLVSATTVDSAWLSAAGSTVMIAVAIALTMPVSVSTPVNTPAAKIIEMTVTMTAPMRLDSGDLFVPASGCWRSGRRQRRT